MHPRFDRPDVEEPDRAALQPDPPHWSMWLVYMVLRPRLFFQLFVVDAAPVLTLLTAWSFGIVGAMDRIELRTLARPDHPLALLKESWGVYWGAVALLGAVSGAMYYLIGGWWYRVRLRWSGDPRPDIAIARRVYVYAAQPYAVPFLIYTIWETWRYATPLAAAAGDDWGAMVLMATPLWSVYVSYRGVRTVFDVRAWPARVWFLILPALLYAIVTGGILAMALLSSWVLEPAPEIGRPLTIEREAFRLSYPGNWSLDNADEDYDPDANFAIEPSMADATIRFWFYAETLDPQDCIDETRANLESSFEMGTLESVTRWGRYAGAGYSGIGSIEGTRFVFLMFCGTAEPPAFEILQVVEEDAVDRVGSGFDLIRDSFETISPR